MLTMSYQWKKKYVANRKNYYSSPTNMLQDSTSNIGTSSLACLGIISCVAYIIYSLRILVKSWVSLWYIAIDKPSNPWEVTQDQPHLCHPTLRSRFIIDGRHPRQLLCNICPRHDTHVHEWSFRSSGARDVGPTCRHVPQTTQSGRRP